MLPNFTGLSLPMIGVRYWLFSIRYRYGTVGPALRSALTMLD